VTTKRKIRFHISEGSQWVKGYILPVGGVYGFKEIEFEQTTDKPFDDACEALKKEMSEVEYHIWYWTWLGELTIEGHKDFYY
jgi:hypothetical protein